MVDLVALGALAISAVTFLNGYRWHPEADPTFVYLGRDSDANLFPDFGKTGIEPFIVGYLVNMGDGRAFNVRVHGINCDVRLWDCRQISETRLGEPTQWVMNDAGRVPELTGETIRYFITVTPPDHPQDANLTRIGLEVHWTPSPTRLHRCRYKRLPFWDIEPRTYAPWKLLARWRKDRRDHHRLHELYRKQALEQRRLLS